MGSSRLSAQRCTLLFDSDTDVFSAGMRIVPNESIGPSVCQDKLRGSYDAAEAGSKEYSGRNISEDLRECSNENAKAYQNQADHEYPCSHCS